MKNNVIVFLGNSNELCQAFGLFGKENLTYKSEYTYLSYENSKYVKYYFEKLDCDIIFLAKPSMIDDLDINEYTNKIIAVSEMDLINEKCHLYREKFSNCKLVFIWMYGEVFYRTLFEKCKKANLDLILSGSNQVGLEEIGIFDYKLNFKYFYYYIGYYYLTSLMSNLKNKKYDTNQLPIFTYAKAINQSSWRNEILYDLHNRYPKTIYNGVSINDSYDLQYPKYKHFETINDYSYRNYNLVFETIYFKNNIECFTTEKTFKALFFNNPFYLVAPTEIITKLSKDFYLLNSEFENLDSFVGNEDLAEKFDYHMDKSKDNLSKLLEYINDYSHIEHFKKLLNI